MRCHPSLVPISNPSAATRKWAISPMYNCLTTADRKMTVQSGWQEHACHTRMCRRIWKLLTVMKYETNFWTSDEHGSALGGGGVVVAILGGSSLGGGLGLGVFSSG